MTSKLNAQRAVANYSLKCPVNVLCNLAVRNCREPFVVAKKIECSFRNYSSKGRKDFRTLQV